MLMPVVVCLVFTINQWMKNETGTRDRLLSLPLLMAMLYLPFVAASLIYLLIKKDRRWLEAKRNYDINISSIGKLKILKSFIQQANQSTNPPPFQLELNKIVLDCVIQQWHWFILFCWFKKTDFQKTYVALFEVVKSQGGSWVKKWEFGSVSAFNLLVFNSNQVQMGGVLNT